MMMNKRLLVVALCTMEYCSAFDDVYYYKSMASDEVITERIYGEWTLKFGYVFPKKLREKAQKAVTACSKVLGVTVMKPADVRFNSPKSKADIQPFIDTFSIKSDESLKPIESFNNFNEFFYRKIKPSVRMVDGRSNILVSPADSKLRMLSGTPNDKVKFYIKQHPFELESFLGNNLVNDYRQAWDLLVFRLAPTDYHRFHFQIGRAHV
jgi:phosphatidylserine decarboxylase